MKICVKEAILNKKKARPEYLGVSIQLYKECANSNRDIEVIYGFPNKNSFPITKFIGHHYVGDICFWTASISNWIMSG